jgi:hypothetical protein
VHYITRIAYNSADWRRPMGDASKLEDRRTHNNLNGYGYEEWLFRSEWQINGWRYAFIQGVNKSRNRLLKTSASVDLTLFTILPDRRRQYIAKIRDVECLTDEQSDDALQEFQRRGWYQTMREEIELAGGNIQSFGSTKWAEHILNVRFRLDNVTRFEPETIAPPDELNNFTRYFLYEPTGMVDEQPSTGLRQRSGSQTAPNATPFTRAASAKTAVTPEHARMQARLMQELQAEHPDAVVVRESDFVDVTVQTKSELLLFEIKSDLNPRSVLRQALGQILEYAYHPSRQHKLPVRLVIVGRCPLAPTDDCYLQYLRKAFSLPLDYRVVCL